MFTFARLDLKEGRGEVLICVRCSLFLVTASDDSLTFKQIELVIGLTDF